jgi:tetratricopeptide (TPR) repeat protein
MLQRAGALLRVRDLPGARNAALAALERGAPEDAVLEVLGITELLEPTTAAAPLALALASSTAHPQAQLIAGTLLLRAGCAGDALPVLRRAASRGEGRRLPPDRSLIATLLLADALLLSGEVEGASEVLATMDDRPLPPRWSGLFHARSRLLAILRRSPDEWPTFVPSMRAAADRWDEEGAESLWLLGQMSETLGDVHRAHDAFLELIDRHEPFAHGAPGRRLLATWQNRVFALLERGEDVEALSVHRATWRRSLHAQMTDPGLLRRVAATYSKFGLHDDALDVLADAAAVEGALGLDEKATALDIADTYRRAGRHTEALEALDFVMTKRPSPDEARTARFIEARAHLDAGRESAALDVLRPLARPNTPGPTRAEAQVWIAVIDARNERCEAALPYLLPATLPDGVDPGVLGLLRSRCLRNLGRDDEARAAAAAARPLLDDAELRSWAGFLGSVGVPTTLPAPEPGQRTARAWDRLAAEEAEWTALREKLGAREENL